MKKYLQIFGFGLVCFLGTTSCAHGDPSYYAPGERWQEVKAATAHCESMCRDIGAWCHRYRHYNTEKCICKNVAWEYFHVTDDDDGVSVISSPSKIDFGK